MLYVSIFVPDSRIRTVIWGNTVLGSNTGHFDTMHRLACRTPSGTNTVSEQYDLFGAFFEKFIKVTGVDCFWKIFTIL